MSEFENPFAYSETQNLYPDSSAQQSVRSQAVHQVLNDYHPFADQSSSYGSQKGAQGPAAATATTPRPAVLEAPAAIVPKPSWEEEELLRKVADLNRRDEELRIREELLFQRNVGFEVRINNFPPFPANCPIQPCFYQDFIVDIPAEFQKIIKMVYYLWIAYSGGLVLNIIGSLAYFISSAEHGISNQSGSTFGYSLLCCLLFVPCSFVCWYRPLYKAFRDDSSINFFVFFFTFFFQFCVSVIQCLGVGGFGTVGLFNSIEMFSAGKAGTVAAGMIMIITGLLFAAVAAANAVALVRVSFHPKIKLVRCLNTPETPNEKYNSISATVCVKKEMIWA